MQGISIHASAREATAITAGCATAFDISIHASAREATRFALDPFSVVAISIHASAREATALKLEVKGILKDFNPRLREGGDYVYVPMYRHRPISIHASAREATSIVSTHIFGDGISIHASAREATRQSII